MCTYKVEVTTEEGLGAGTDAKIWVCIFGKKGDTGEHELVSTDVKNPFEAGQVDAFTFTAPDVGVFTRLRVKSDGSGIFTPWHMGQIMVYNLDTHQKKKYSFHGWIDQEHGLVKLLDGTHEVVLVAKV